ncbi:hypothetical protein C8R43DRAFT_1009190 [Mycena crocata]|nr:hypothetical protein C8R43DRAFT_1009190 [Mycena crocata]
MPIPNFPRESTPYEVVVADSRLTNYLAASAFTVLFIDLFSTIDEEIDFVWRRPWRVPSILYLWNRYATLLVVTICMPFLFGEIQSDKSCRSFVITEGIASTLLFGTFDLMLMLRVWILYEKSPQMAYILFPILFVEMLSMIVILLLPETYPHEFYHIGPTLCGCYIKAPMMTGSSLAFYALPPLLVTFTLFILTIHKCILTLQPNKVAELPIVTLFLRDGIVWFVVVFFFYGTEMIIWAGSRSTLTQVLIVPSLALFSLISSRFLLHTKSLSSQSEADDDEEEHERLLPPVGSRVNWRG